jgi:serine/threonine protein kinase/formylglycine-generating enzyme required for sulfatase activity
MVQRFEDAWHSSQHPAIEDYLPHDPSQRLTAVAKLVQIDLERRLSAGEAVQVESYLNRFPELTSQPDLVVPLVQTEYNQRRKSLPAFNIAEYFQRFPQFQERLRQLMADDLTEPPGAQTDSFKALGGLAASNEGAAPAWLGRYRITGVLGSGGFGVVYKGHDDDLRREVAIKVPHRERITTPQDAEAYLAEARILASLDHPHIVPVHDLGRTEDGLCFVVAKFIPGSDLAHKLQTARLSLSESAELTAAIADALHHAHKHGLVHRDVKPGNILLHTEGRPYLADFGLALKEEDYGKGAGVCGTYAYMSPEQANGEGHRVDGRSDIFSLGSVFYELLTGKRPFPGETPADIIIRISCDEPRPPRQVDDAIPRELERICLKALAKKASERYSTAKDLADDLRQWVAGDGWRVAGEEVTGGGPGVGAFRPSSPATRHPPTATPSTPSAMILKVVPKGLRSFDEHDADFFLELLPGPRDREGLPDSIRFWKTRIEESDLDRTFSVGLIYGPSGCGKSSLVKAGLLPRLPENVSAVYVEATAAETEIRLLNQLRKRCPALPHSLGLRETLTALRRGQGSLAAKKVLIVLDQFEQWLHARRGEENTELVHSLRQCDGGRLQCMVMVRDDFWMAATRFMRELEVRLVEGQNSAAVDLFPIRHAEKVLAAFGRAFGALPENAKETSKEQAAFVKQAVQGLANEGKVICVRLALFAEMMKGKSWTPATLKAVGGTEGVGVTFLEETFSAASAPPEHRYHQGGARSALHALLPETGSDIKGHMRSYGELLEASGYGNRPKDFDDLIRILDKEIRLITPTDPEGVISDEWRVTSEIRPKREGQGANEDKPEGTVLDSRHLSLVIRHYQLTHDYLVPSLREWLTRKQKETRRGRAELRLAERAAQWNVKPEKRHLPAWWEWVNIRLFTRKKNWTSPQQKMMRRAARYHALRGAALALLVAVVTISGLMVRGQVVEQRNATYAAGLVQAVLNADTTQLPAMIDGMAEYRQWTNPRLREVYDQAADKSRQKLHASLALLPADGTQAQYLTGRLLKAEPREVAVIRDALAPHQDQLLEKLWLTVENPEKGEEQQRIRAAAALAQYDPDSEKWAKVQELLGNDLVAVPAVYLSLWVDALRPVRAKLFPQLSTVYRDAARRETERSLATDILADYAADNPPLLADLLMDADDKQFAVIFRVASEGWRVAGEMESALISELDKKLPPELLSSDGSREKLAKRQANAAVMLLRMNRPEKVWPLLRHPATDYSSPATHYPPPFCDPRVRSYLIHRLAPLGVNAKPIVNRLNRESDLTARRALLLCLGEFGAKDFTPDEALVEEVRETYRTAADPGLHAASEWLLRTWKQEAWLKQTNEEWAKAKVKGERWWDGKVAGGASKVAGDAWRVTGKDKNANPDTRHPSRATPQWYLNCQGQTMVVIPGPVEFVMGAPRTKGLGWLGKEHPQRIGRSFAVAAKLVTLAEYQRFDPAHGESRATDMKQWVHTSDSPVVSVTWFQAVEYCNWLSKQEGIGERDWCYEPFHDPKAWPLLAVSSVGLLGTPGGPGPLLARGGMYPGRTDAKFEAGMSLASNYLERQGYRLPTEAEMEYATRAGALTARYYGEMEDLLPRYSWYAMFDTAEETILRPVGTLKPNDLGLFDMHGNAIMWCQERHKEVPQGKEMRDDKEDDLVVSNTDSRALRGAAFNTAEAFVRCAMRYGELPWGSSPSYGFRPVRTLPPDP